jgi:hypothetical protein
LRQGPRTSEIKSIPPTCRESACVSAAAARRSISSIPTSFRPVSGTTNYSLEGSRFTLEIIKTAATTGSGTLAAGKYTSYDWESGGNPILETYLSANAITVVSPSCTVMSGKNMNVDVGSIRRSDLKGVGTTAGGKDFNIDLQCSGGLSETGICQHQHLVLRNPGYQHDGDHGRLAE